MNHGIFITGTDTGIGKTWAGIVLTRLEANRHRVIKSPRMAQAADRAYLKIVAPWQGSAGVQQMGRQAWVRPGGWAIYDTSGDYEVANPERVEHLIVMLPKEQLIERGLRLEPLSRAAEPEPADRNTWQMAGAQG